MKKILLLIAIVIGWTGAEAQQTVCKTVKTQKTAYKPAKKKVNKRVAVQNNANACKLVPKDVCTISPDRRSVTCYQTIDGTDYKQYGTKTKVYGPTGPMPGGKAKFETETIVVKREASGSYCTRDHDAKVTTCYDAGHGICRDKAGFYSYCKLGDAVVKKANKKGGKRYAKTVTTQYAAGNNSVVLK